MPPEPLDYQPVTEEARSPRRLVVRVAKFYVLIYFLAVAALTTVKLVAPVQLLPWPEVFYGPGITLGCCFLLFSAAVWIGARRNRRDA